MKIENLFTENTTINITVLKINNKNFTKSIFNQLHLSSPFTKLYELKEDLKILGYVNDKTRWVIWTDNEFLYKYDIKKFYPLLKLEINICEIGTLLDIYPSEDVRLLSENLENYDLANILNEEEKKVINNKKETVEKILKEVVKRQIFL
jgi:hypothetical protein